MTRFAIDAPTLLRIVREGIDVGVGDKAGGFLGVDQPRLVGEEIVRGRDHLGAQTRLGEVHILLAQLLEHQAATAGWVARQWRAMSMRRQNQTS